MSHPESDGAAEMLEGGIRAMSTGALRMAETMQRRQQWAARHHAEQLRHDTRRVQQQQRALAAADDVARGAAPARKRSTAVAVTSRGTPVVPAVPTARQLFPHFAPEVADAAMNDLVVHGDLPAYLHARRSATEEAGRAGRSPDSVELHRRAVELFTEAHHETAAAHHDRTEARELDKLRQHLAANDLTATAGAHDFNSGAADLGQFEPVVIAADAVESYDSATARERRADAVRAQGYDVDTTASALLHDLSFGVPATAAVRKSTPTTTTAAKPTRRSRSRTQQLTR